MTAQAQKPDSVFQQNGRVHLYRRGCQFSRVLAFLECGSAGNDCSNTGWTVLSQAEDCWIPTPFASFCFTSPPVHRRVPPDSVSTIPQILMHYTQFLRCFLSPFACYYIRMYIHTYIFHGSISLSQRQYNVEQVINTQQYTIFTVYNTKTFKKNSIIDHLYT